MTLVVNAPAPASGADWPTIEHDPGRTGIAPAETQIGTANAASLTQNWSATLDGKVSAQPLFLSGVQVMGATHDVVIAATNQNTLYALDASTGTVLWSNHLAAVPASCGIPGGFGISGAPVADRSTGRIFAVTDDGDLRTVSLANGSEAAPALPLVSPPATNYVWGGLNLINGNLFIASGSNGCDTPPYQGGIYQVNVSGPAPKLVNHWLTVPSLPATQAGGGIWGWGGVSVDSSTGHVYAASADDATNLGGNAGYTPYSGSLLALDNNLHLLGWYQPPQPPNYNCGSAPPCDQDFASTPLPFHPPGCPVMLAAGNKNGDLYVTSEASLEADTGHDGTNVQAIKLNQTIDDLGLGGLSGTPVYDPATNMLYTVDSGPGANGVAGGLAALAVQPNCSLTVAWSQTVGTAISNSPNSTPTVANGVIYAGVNDGSVSAFDASTGARLWNSGSQGSAVYAAPIVANGRLIAGSWSGASGSAAGKVTAWTPSTLSAPTVPGAPANVSAAPGNTSAVVSWSAPGNGGSPITSYTVTPYIGSSAQSATTVTGNPPATSTTITGLTNGTAYTFTVAAANAIGTGPASTHSTPVTPVATSQPVLDAHVSINASGNPATTSSFSTAQAGETLVAFLASDGPATAGAQGSTVSGAGLTWKLDGRANTRYGTAEVWSATAPSALTNVTVTATETRATYDQMLTVMSFEGSSGIGAVQTGGATTGAPSVTLTTSASDSLIYGVGNDWDTATARTAGANQTVINQWADTHSGDTFWVQDQNNPVAGPGSAATINDTSPATDQWNLAAVEILGSAPATPTVPSSPTGVTATAGNGLASVSWTAPSSNGGSAITSYTVTPYVGGVPQQATTVSDSPPVTSAAVTGLTNGTSYTFVVSATNAIGTGTASAPSNAVTPAAVGPITVDKTVVTDGSGAMTSPGLTTSTANDLIVAFVSSDGPAGGGQQTVTVTGAGLTWTLAKRGNGQSGDSEIWWARASGTLSSQTVTATPSHAGFDGSLVVVAFAKAAGIGVTAASGAASGAPDLSLAGTGAGSWVYAVGDDWDNAIARTSASGQVIMHQRLDTTSGDTFWVQSTTAPDASAGTVDIHDSVPTSDQWNYVGVEILPGS